MCSAILKCTQNLTNSEDMRNQTKLIIQPYANWEEYLTPAPLSILGELVFISSSTDFSINKNPPKMSKLRKQSAQETKKRTEKVMSAMEKELDQAHESYNTALKSLPNGWEMIGMDVVGGISQSVTVLVNRLINCATQPSMMPLPAAVIADTASHVKVQERARDVVAEINVYSKSAEILNCAQTIQQLMNVNSTVDDIDWTYLYGQKNKTTKTDFIAKQFERINKTLKKISDCSAKIQAQMLCKDGIKICNQLVKYAPDGKCDETITNSPAIFPKPPMMYKEENKAERGSNLQRATESAGFSIEQIRAQLNKTRETYEKCVENLEKNQKELTEILVTMRNCELKEIDFRTTVEMLVKGMDAMGRVKEQWEKMVHFFQMVSNIVKTSLKKTQALSYNAKLFSKDLLYNQAFQASNIATLVHMISATYTDVSSKYLKDHVSSLGKLMAMDKSKPEFKHFDSFSPQIFLMSHLCAWNNLGDMEHMGKKLETPGIKLTKHGRKKMGHGAKKKNT
uniref:Uncharacterized protein n=1 Tax=Cyprinus carpio TaxID=7962 RepID=A0A8C1TN07_CYPCA